MKLFILFYVFSLNIFADRIYACSILSLGSEYSNKKNRKNKKTNCSTLRPSVCSSECQNAYNSYKTFPLEHLKINNIESEKFSPIDKISINKQEIYFHFSEDSSDNYSKISLSDYTMFIGNAIEIKKGLKLIFEKKDEFLEFKKIFQHLVSLVNLREAMMSALVFVERCGKKVILFL